MKKKARRGSDAPSNRSKDASRSNIYKLEVDTPSARVVHYRIITARYQAQAAPRIIEDHPKMRKNRRPNGRLL